MTPDMKDPQPSSPTVFNALLLLCEYVRRKLKLLQVLPCIKGNKTLRNGPKWGLHRTIGGGIWASFYLMRRSKYA
jgi:hypothetical protein